MGTTDEAVVTEFMDAWGDGARRDPDVEKKILIEGEKIPFTLSPGD